MNVVRLEMEGLCCKHFGETKVKGSGVVVRDIVWWSVVDGVYDADVGGRKRRDAVAGSRD
jgi:hypothetical protein